MAVAESCTVFIRYQFSTCQISWFLVNKKYPLSFESLESNGINQNIQHK